MNAQDFSQLSVMHLILGGEQVHRFLEVQGGALHKTSVQKAIDGYPKHMGEGQD